MSGPPKIVVWEWEIEFQGWRPYSGPVSTYIEHQYQNNKHKNLTLPLGNADPKLASFYIDLQTMEQIRIANCPVKRRKIRRQLFPASSPLGQGIVWEWSGDGNNEWLSYDIQALFILENAFLNGINRVDLTQSPTFIPYTVDLSTMIQEQVHTGYKRRVRRTLNGPRFPLDMTGRIPPPYALGSGPPLNNSIFGQFTSANTLPSSSFTQLNGSQSTQHPASGATFGNNASPFQSSQLFGQGPQIGVLAPVVPSNSVPATSISGNPHNNPLNLKKNYSKTNSAANNPPPKRQKHSHPQPQFFPFQQIPMQNHFSQNIFPNGATNIFHRPIFGTQANHQLPGGSLNQGAVGGPSILGLPPSHNGFPMVSGAMLKPPPAHQGAPAPSMAYSLPTGPSHTVQSISDNDAATVLMQFVKITTDPPKDDDCPICCEGLNEDSGYAEKKSSDPSIVAGLKKCGHFFHKMCLEAMYESGTKDGSLQCPTCKAIYGEKHGHCPPGKMEYDTLNQSLPGHPGCGTIRIMYHIFGGLQGPSHPNPGFPYKARGFPRQGFLPDSERGRKVLKMLIKAWERKLTFTIGTSSTTGENDCVIWNEIHHKTEFGSNRSGHGYPDPNYLDNVTLELIAQGVTEEDIEP